MELSNIEILTLLFVGWQASTLYRHWKDGQTIKLIIKEIDAEEERINEKIIDEVKARLPICYVEKHGVKDYLLYNRDTEEFVCQGKSYEELAQACKDRFDTVLVKADNKSMWFADGKVKEITE
jgi:hypothetical protein